jgi:hypothetical protein
VGRDCLIQIVNIEMRLPDLLLFSAQLIENHGFVAIPVAIGPRPPHMAMPQSWHLG